MSPSRRASTPVTGHPIERFRAPRAITAGSPLKDLFDRRLVGLIGDSIAAVHRDFDRAAFVAQAADGLAALELSDRARHIAAALDATLPTTATAGLRVLVASLGPPIPDTRELGLRPFFYLPHNHYIARRGVEDLPAALAACQHLTRRFTAEFALRPLILTDADAVLATLREWTADPDPHVRRLVSEGTRPRLPWAPRLPAFQADPGPTLALLERLHRDPVRYVQRSVANHLGDIAKDHPQLALDRCRRWLDQSRLLDDAAGRDLRWIVRHSLRHPARRGDPAALELRSAAR